MPSPLKCRMSPSALRRDEIHEAEAARVVIDDGGAVGEAEHDVVVGALAARPHA